MRIFYRLLTMLRSNLNHLIGMAEDPEKILEQTLSDMQESLISAKNQVAIAMADEKKLIQQYETEKQNAVDWENRAMYAVQKQNDTLASQALARFIEHKKLAAGFEESWRIQNKSVERLKFALKNLSEKIMEAKRQKNLLIARAKKVKAQKTISDTLSGISANSGIDEIKRMEDKINQMENESEAIMQLANDTNNDALLDDFNKLKPIVHNDLLIELKKKMKALNDPNIKQINK